MFYPKHDGFAALVIFVTLNLKMKQHIKSQHEGTRYTCEECEYKAQ